MLPSRVRFPHSRLVLQRRPPSPAFTRIMLPEKLNETPDERVFELVDNLVLSSDAGRQQVEPLAPFLTLEILRRVHERIVQLINTGSCKMAKHKALACAMCGMTGVLRPPDMRDVEKIGNHIDIFLRRKYIDKERKLCRNIRNKENLEQQRASLRLCCCIVSSMGRIEEFFGPFPDEEQGSAVARKRALLVPYTNSTVPAAMSMLELKSAAIEAQRKVEAAQADAKRERLRHDNQRVLAEAIKSRCKRVAAQAATARKLAKSRKDEMTQAMAQAANDLREFAKKAQSDAARREREASEQLREEKAKVLLLGYQVAAASQEAAVHAQRESDLEKKARVDRQRAEAELRQRQEDAEAQRAEHRRAERDSSKALLDARATVLRLGNQVAAASQEAAMHAQREAEAILLLEEERARVELMAERCREEVAMERAQRRADERAVQKQLLDAWAAVLRLGSQVASASQEAAKLANEKARIERAKEEKERESQECKAEQEYLMLKVKSEAKARRECARQRDAALQLKNLAKQTSQKRLQARNELAERCCVLEAEYDELHIEVTALREELGADAGAAAKLASMPTWRHERKRGRRGGGMQLQYQHRLAVLEQHANGTPPSAIGQNIISIVKKVAPWLEPVQPSHREIQQIGFELPTLEEALAARRTAAAYRVRLLGFDETTDLQVPVITSNVQVQDTPGAQTEDVVLKAAYISTKGGTSVAVASEIEDKCFARLRELLRLWRNCHDSMFPDAQWTGPDSSNSSLHRLAGGGALISDTCNAARKTRRLLTEMIQNQAEAVLRDAHGGQEAWASFTEDERAELLRVYVLDCHHHLRKTSG